MDYHHIYNDDIVIIIKWHLCTINQIEYKFRKSMT
jgi:hypothetical protein